MDNQNLTTEQLQELVIKLQSQVDSLSQNFYKDNFSNSQAFNKEVTFNTRLRVPIYSSAPSVGEIGDLVAVGGQLFICTTAGNVATPATFTLVGSQS